MSHCIKFICIFFLSNYYCKASFLLLQITVDCVGPQATKIEKKKKIPCGFSFVSDFSNFFKKESTSDKDFFLKNTVLQCMDYEAKH